MRMMHIKSDDLRDWCCDQQILKLMIILVILDRMAWQSCQILILSILILSRENYFVCNKYYGLNVSLVQYRWERGHLSSVSLSCPISFVKEETLLYFLHMFPHECHFPGHCYNLVGYELNRDTNDASTIFICVPIWSVIVVFSGPTNIASRKVMIRIIPSLLVRVGKYLTSLSIVLVV